MIESYADCADLIADVFGDAAMQSRIRPFARPDQAAFATIPFYCRDDKNRHSKKSFGYASGLGVYYDLLSRITHIFDIFAGLLLR